MQQELNVRLPGERRLAMRQVHEHGVDVSMDV
jgi:hypothetical protein